MAILLDVISPDTGVIYAWVREEDLDLESRSTPVLGFSPRPGEAAGKVYVDAGSGVIIGEVEYYPE